MDGAIARASVAIVMLSRFLICVSSAQLGVKPSRSYIQSPDHFGARLRGRIMAGMALWQLDASAAERLHRDAKAAQWGVSVDTLARAIERGVRHVFGDDPPEPARLDRHLKSLRLDELALACACAEGRDEAWEHFIREYRPGLYRAAAAIDPSGGARELADALYGELFGLSQRDGTRRSHFEYFHGRSSLATGCARCSRSGTWTGRVPCAAPHPLPEDESPAALARRHRHSRRSTHASSVCCAPRSPPRSAGSTRAGACASPATMRKGSRWRRLGARWVSTRPPSRGNWPGRGRRSVKTSSGSCASRA